ncbi:dynein intermediate chain CFAP94, axonemal isoform X2 [Cyprinodon tularosa]|uniref:dynein intermediate chain CFAP94, axonemal isoform X2 n=1 Tax=Cyprinodon tularosa TaxID=77115 RepID=UPI0018E26638|nr:dynein intermediate chain CFAP94, axonemal isoform X2 [Cyprinodon tularosa]
MKAQKKKKTLKSQKQKEEEEAARLQLQLEREEQERLENERKQQEIQWLEEKVLEKREEELLKLNTLLEKNSSAITKWKTAAAEKAAWERYMRCDGYPDPKDQRAVNTFISLWRDDLESNVAEQFDQSTTAIRLAEDLHEPLQEAKDPKEVLKYQEALMEMQELFHSKHLFIAEKILKGTCEKMDPDATNLQHEYKHERLTLCLWANLFKDLNLNEHRFEEAGLSFMLPMQLVWSAVAVRMLHTHYDHLSILVRIRHQAQKQVEEEKELPIEELDQKQASSRPPSRKSSASSKRGRSKISRQMEACNSQMSSSDFSDSPTKDPLQASSRPPSRKCSAQSSRRSRSKISTQMEALNSQMSSPDFSDSPTKDPIVPQPKVIRSGAQVVDVMQYTSVGGVFYCDLFHLPPRPIRRKGYTILQLEDGLRVFPYPTGKPSNEACPPVGVSVTLPDWITNVEPPLVARWDAGDKQWRWDGITDVSYEKAEAKISFKMETFQTFALMQKTYANLPFQGWELQPLGQDSLLFTIKGAIFDITITIKNDQCMLQLEQQRGLSHLVGKWMSGHALQKAMLKAGVNIFVNEHTHKYVSFCRKESLTEQVVYKQMALFASACAFSWSKWNAKCGEEHLVLQVCEHHDPSPVPEASWGVYLVGAEKSQKLKITENSEAFSPEHVPGSLVHNTFIHMLEDNMSPDGIDMTRNSNYCFVDTVQNLLCATRPLVFS